MEWTREYAEGRKLPWGCGIAYHDWLKHSVIILPIPINLIVRWLRELWFILGRPSKRDREIQALRGTSYYDGYKRGQIDGMKIAIRAIETQDLSELARLVKEAQQ